MARSKKTARMEVTSNHLASYLNQIHSFLTNDRESHAFSSLTMAMEDILVNIAKDANVLKQGRFDDDCKSIAAKISSVLEESKNVFTLSYDFECNELGNREMVYKKTPVAVFKEPPAIRPMRRPNLTTPKVEKASTSMMSSFKTTSLNATLKFVKNDKQLALQYPDMSTEQADFVTQMINQCMQNKEAAMGFKGLYDTLSEALQIYSEKYSFELNSEIRGDMKTLRFVKTPLDKKSGENSDLDSSFSSMSSKTGKKLRKSEKKVRQLTKIIRITSHNFKADALRQMNEFINDSAKETLTLNGLKDEEMKFYENIRQIIKRNDVMQLFDVSEQMVLSEIHDNCKTISKTGTRFKIFPDGTDPSNRTITFKKKHGVGLRYGSVPDNPTTLIPGTEAPVIDDDYMGFSDSSLSSDCSVRSTVFPVGFTSTEQNTTEVPSDTWLISTLTQIITFIMDETEASILFTNLPAIRMEFLMKLQKSLNNHSFIEPFKREVKDLLNDLRRLLKEYAQVFTMSFEVDTRKKRRDITFIKNPCFPNKQEQRKVTEDKVDNGATNTKNYRKIVKSESISNANKTEIPKTDVKGSISTPKDGGNKKENTVTKTATETRDIQSSTRRYEYESIEKMYLTFRNYMINKKKSDNVISNTAPCIPKAASASSLPVDKGLEDKGRPNSASVNVQKSAPVNAQKSAPVNVQKSAPVNAQKSALVNVLKGSKNQPIFKAKLIEGLSQPVVSEKGLKMMRIMGWDGGALGLRGEGIVEPIMPSLDMSNRAGLGSQKPPTKQLTSVITNLPLDITQVLVPYVPTKFEMKIGILQTILKMIKEGATATDVNFRSDVSLKTWSFVRLNVTSLNQRLPLVQQADFDDVRNRILDLLNGTPNIITACWGVSKKNILFLISTNVYQPTDIDSSDWCSVVSFENAAQKAKEANGPRFVVEDGNPFRHYVLAQILDFCTKSSITIDKGPSNSKIFKDIVLKGSMVLKQMSYIRDLIRRLNSKTRSSTDFKNENYLHDEIVSILDGYVLDVEFPLQKNKDESGSVYNTIRLYKIFDVPITTQSAKNKPSTETPASPKIEIKSVESINKWLLADNTNKTTKLSEFTKAIDKTTKTLSEALEKTQICNKTKNKQDINVEKDYAKESDNSKQHSIYNDILKEKRVIQNATNNSKNLSKDDNLPNSQIVENCICCLPDFNEKNTEISNEIDKTYGQRVEYIFDKENIEINNTDDDRPMPADNDINMPMVTKNDKENDLSTIENDKTLTKANDTVNESARTMVTVNKGTDSAISNENGKKNNMLFAIENIKNYDRITTNNDVKDMIKQIQAVSLMDVSLQNINDQDLNSLTAIYQTKSTEEILNDLVVQSENLLLETLKKAPIDKNDQNEDLYKTVTDKTTDLGKRHRITQKNDHQYKKCKYSEFETNITIVPKDYPQTKITNKMAAEIQKSILESIDYTRELPVLNCHGIQDGGLTYSCHSKKSLNLIENVIKSFDFKIKYVQKIEMKRFKMAFRVNTFLEESLEIILKRLELFNQGLSTKDWAFVKKELCSDFIVIYVEVDCDSYKFICSEKFYLNYGIDVAKFNIVWD